MLKNKGQISMFVVIGVILIVLFAFFIFSSDLNPFVSTEKKLSNQIKETVERCIYDSVERGTFLLGFQGGYIEIPEEKARDPRQHLDLGFKVCLSPSCRLCEPEAGR